MCDESSGGDSDGTCAPGALSSVRLRDGLTLRVPVPPGTFVRTSGGKVLDDLVAPGQELRVAAGGEGGPCVLREERAARGGGAKGGRGRSDEFASDGLWSGDDDFVMSDDELQELTRGRPPVRRRKPRTSRARAQPRACPATCCAVAQPRSQPHDAQPRSQPRAALQWRVPSHSY